MRQPFAPVQSFRCHFCLILQRNCQTWENRWRHWKRKMWHTWKKPWIYKRYALQAWLNRQMNSVESFFNEYNVEEPSGHFRKVLLGRGLTEVNLGVVQLGCNLFMLHFKIYSWLLQNKEIFLVQCFITGSNAIWKKEESTVVVLFWLKS